MRKGQLTVTQLAAITLAVILLMALGNIMLNARKKGTDSAENVTTALGTQSAEAYWSVKCQEIKSRACLSGCAYESSGNNEELPCNGGLPEDGDLVIYSACAGKAINNTFSEKTDRDKAWDWCSHIIYGLCGAKEKQSRSCIGSCAGTCACGSGDITCIEVE